MQFKACRVISQEINGQNASYNSDLSPENSLAKIKAKVLVKIIYMLYFWVTDFSDLRIPFNPALPKYGRFDYMYY